MSGLSAPPSDAALTLGRCRTFRGSVSPPGSKSIANRALLLAALCAGNTRLSNVPDADDVQLLVRALRQLGVELEAAVAGRGAEPGTASRLQVKGCAGALPSRGGEIFLGNAGTAMRPLTAVLACGRGEFTLDGDEHMRRRPIGDLVAALAARGVRVQCSPAGTPPVQLSANGLPGGLYELSGTVSSQFVSALLLAAPLAEAPLEIALPTVPVSIPYIDLTIHMMNEFGCAVERSADYRRYQVGGRAYVSPGDYLIECDASAATYFLAAGALPGCGPVRVQGISPNSRQGDVHFVDVLEKMGARVRRGPDFLEVESGRALRGIEVDMNAMPDAAMTLAVLALFAEGPTYIRNVANLRVKESERLRGLHSELVKLGARVDEEPDALRVHPPAALQRARIATYDDHRMAMAFALASYGTEVVIENPGCTSKTYPAFFADFSAIQHGTS